MITDIEEETQDYDWFAVDPTGALAHFTSGGRGFIPQSIKASSNRDRLALATYFRCKISPVGAAELSAGANAILLNYNEKDKLATIKDYVDMASKGLYSFDCVVANKRPSEYFLVASPTTPLRTADLPDELRDIIARTRLRHVLPGGMVQTEDISSGE